MCKNGKSYLFEYYQHIVSQKQRFAEYFDTNVTVPGKRAPVAPDKTSFVCLRGISHSAYTHTKFERVGALLKGQAHCLKTPT